MWHLGIETYDDALAVISMYDDEYPGRALACCGGFWSEKRGRGPDESALRSSVAESDLTEVIAVRERLIERLEAIGSDTKQAESNSCSVRSWGFLGAATTECGAE
jgi:hypothetical protein